MMNDDETTELTNLVPLLSLLTAFVYFYLTGSLVLLAVTEVIMCMACSLICIFLLGAVKVAPGSVYLFLFIVAFLALVMIAREINAYNGVVNRRMFGIDVFVGGRSTLSGFMLAVGFYLPVSVMMFFFSQVWR